MFTGNLTIKATTKPVHFLFTTIAKDDGYLFAGQFEINRIDYSVGSESSTMSDKVNVSLSAFSK